MSNQAAGKTAREMWDELQATDFQRSSFEKKFLDTQAKEKWSLAMRLKWGEDLTEKQLETLKAMYLEHVHGVKTRN